MIFFFFLFLFLGIPLQNVGGRCEVRWTCWPRDYPAHPIQWSRSCRLRNDVTTLCKCGGRGAPSCWNTSGLSAKSHICNVLWCIISVIVPSAKKVGPYTLSVVTAQNIGLPMLALALTCSVWVCGLSLVSINRSRNMKRRFIPKTPSWKVRGCIQKFPEWVDNEIKNNNKHSLRSNTKGYGGKTH
jgi:hypothetical protein